MSPQAAIAEASHDRYAHPHSVSARRDRGDERRRRKSANATHRSRPRDRLDQDDVGTAVDQAVDLFAIGDAQIIERDSAIARIVNVRRDGGRAVCRADRTGDKTALSVLALGTDGRAASNERAPAVKIVD